MKAFIIAGGFGTRMRPLTDTVPKSLLPVLNKPFLAHQLEQLAEHGVTNTTLLTGYLAADFASFADTMRARGIQVTISTEPEPLGTAGAVRRVLGDFDGTSLVLNGDAVVAGMDWSAAVEAHRKSGATATLVLVRLADAKGYGLVPFDDDRTVTGFEQLSMQDGGRAGWINAGNYVLEPRAIESVPADTTWSFETQVFPGLAARGDLRAFPSEGHWLDFGTPDRYLQGHFDVLEGRARLSSEGHLMRETKTFDDGTTITGPVLLSHAPVAPGAQLGPLACIGPRARIGAGARIERSVIHGEAEIGDSATIVDSIVGAGARVEPGATLLGAVVA